MKYYVEENLSDFKFWSGAKCRAELLTEDQFGVVERILESVEPEDGWSDTAINDMFWFDFDTIAEWLGYKDEEYFEKGISNDTIEEVQEQFNDVIRAEDNIEDIFALAGLDMSKYLSTDEDGEEEVDYDSARDDIEEWWNGKSEMEQVEFFRNYKFWYETHYHPLKL